MKTPIITLTSDLGMKDPYVAEMKAVIMSICPEAHIIDVSHEIEKFNVRNGAFVLASAAPYFSKGTIHVAVVDPGVGTRRSPILVETNHEFFIGPDNGLLLLAAQKQEIRHVYKITNPRCILSRVSKTFHGRDIFAPAAAHLAQGSDTTDFGPEIKDYTIPKFSRSESTPTGLRGEVLHTDDFGNIITNVRKADLRKIRIRKGSALQLKLKVKDLTLKFASAYGETKIGKPLALIGSHDFLEFSVNQGNASKEFGAKAGDSFIIVLKKQD